MMPSSGHRNVSNAASIRSGRAIHKMNSARRGKTPANSANRVVVVVAAEVELDPVDLAGEPAVLVGVVGSDGGAGFVADVGGLVGREDHRLGVLHPTGPDRLAVVVQGDVAAFGQPPAVVGELHAHLVGAGGDRGVGGGREFDWLDAWLDPPSIVDDNMTGSRDETVVRVGRSELARAEIAGGTLRLITGVAGREEPSAIHLDRWSAVSIDLHRAAAVADDSGQLDSAVP
jgi:hypothetical protein